MNIEIYGIPEHLHNCYGCVESLKLLESKGIKYNFYPVLISSNNELGFEYDRDRIEELARRLNSRGLAFTYPRIFVDDRFIGGYKQLKDLLNNEGE